MEYACISDIGLIREKNQDSYIAIENKYGDFLAVVADGIGGGRAGEVASSETIKHFEENFKESGPFETSEQIIDYLNLHIEIANKRVHDLSIKNSEYRGMGTTMTGILISKVGNICFNCGDSRVYGIVDKKMIKLTKDHTLVNQMLDNGQITYEESINHPKKHYLVKAIGVFDVVKPDVHKVKEMEYFLICSDGLHGYCSEEEMMMFINTDSKIEDKISDLKNLALLKGGYDNVTIILVKC